MWKKPGFETNHNKEGWLGLHPRREQAKRAGQSSSGFKEEEDTSTVWRKLGSVSMFPDYPTTEKWTLFENVHCSALRGHASHSRIRNDFLPLLQGGDSVDRTELDRNVF